MSNQDPCDQIKAFLTENGYELYDLRQGHACGLPCTPFVKVKAEYSPVDGLSFLAVFPTRVVRYALPCPYNHNDWQNHGSQNYSTPEELKATLDKMIHPPAGCWGATA
jgi:hypothetical protein